MEEEQALKIATEVSNEVYKAVYEKVYMHEVRGRNAHQFAQRVAEDAKEEVAVWLMEQK